MKTSDIIIAAKQIAASNVALNWLLEHQSKLTKSDINVEVSASVEGVIAPHEASCMIAEVLQVDVSDTVQRAIDFCRADIEQATRVIRDQLDAGL